MLSTWEPLSWWHVNNEWVSSNSLSTLPLLPKLICCIPCTSMQNMENIWSNHTHIKWLKNIAHKSWWRISNFNIGMNVFEGGCNVREDWGGVSSMLDVHIRLECGDSGMLQKVELTLSDWWGKNAGWFPTDSVTIVLSMFSGSTLDVASRTVGMIIESKTYLMLFDPLYEGTTGLANILLVAISTGNFVYDIFDIA